MKLRLVGVVIVVVLMVMVVSVTTAQEPQTSFSVEPVLTSLQVPVDYIELPDDSNRFVVVEQRGVVHMVVEGEVLPEPFLDIRDRVLFPDGFTERGLLGFTFDPAFVDNGYFYVNYTSRQPVGTTFVSRFSVLEADANVADKDSEMVVITLDQPYANHNGGMIDFGPDGYLYVSFGDGGNANDPLGHGQNRRTLLGSIVRLDVSSAQPYAIPSDNPFIDDADGAPEIWAYGLRNVWRFSFDMQTGDLFMADVGQNEYEEINFQPADSAGGENYGWNNFEGTSRFRGAAIENTVMPVAEYPHSQGCSVTGGYVYRGEALPELDGYYIYGDFCTGSVWWLVQDENGVWQSDILFETDMSISAFAQDLDGEVYIIDHRGGIYKIVAG